MSKNGNFDTSNSAFDDASLSAANQNNAHAVVKEYYGKTLSQSSDLKTTACCVATKPTSRLEHYVALLHDETRARFFGCGLIAPEALDGARILDLGCGAGRDVYVLAQMVGPEGFVVGVDMTPEQLAVARAHEEWHRDKFGYARSNVAFHDGLIEALDNLPLEPGSFDVAVSNCVINLVPDKAAALAGVRRLLKPGGEFYFSDVYSDRRLPDALRADPVLYGECLGGALYWRDFIDIARKTGFADPRLVTAAPIEASSSEVGEKLGDAKFVSATYRLFAIDSLSERREDEGHRAVYHGGLEGAENAFAFDQSLILERGEPKTIDANAAEIFMKSRFNALIEIEQSVASENFSSATVNIPAKRAEDENPFGDPSR